jgi:hypothetical protein
MRVNTSLKNYEPIDSDWSQLTIAVVQYGKPRTDQQSNFFEGK